MDVKEAPQHQVVVEHGIGVNTDEKENTKQKPIYEWRWINGSDIVKVYIDRPCPENNRFII